jgi:hypothetical protein
MSGCWICPSSRALGSTLVSVAILCNNWYFFNCDMLLILRYTGRYTWITLLTTLLHSKITSKIAQSWLHCSSNNCRCLMAVNFLQWNFSGNTTELFIP